MLRRHDVNRNGCFNAYIMRFIPSSSFYAMLSVREDEMRTQRT